MELSDEICIVVLCDVVYVVLNDLEVLWQCIFGCEELIQYLFIELEVKVVLKIGLVKVKFVGEVMLDQFNVFEVFFLMGEGKGGVVGFVKGGVDVILIEDGGEIILVYIVKVDVGGKIVQFGSCLIVGMVKKLFGNFFVKFSEVVVECWVV